MNAPPPWPAAPSTGERRILSALGIAAALALVSGLVMPTDAFLAMARVLSRDGHLAEATGSVLRRIPLICGVLILAMSTAYAVRDLFVVDLGRGLGALAGIPARRWAMGLFLLALGLRLAWVLLVPSVPVSDFREYLDLASRLHQTGRFAAGNGAPTAFRPPGHPVLLAVLQAGFGGSIVPAKVANALLGSLTCLLAWRLAATSLPEGPARLAGLIVALFPSQVGYSSLIASEVPFTTLQMAGLVLAAESARRCRTSGALRLAAGAGLALSAAAMIRPTAALLPGALAVAIAARAGVRRGIPVLLSLCVAFAPLPIAWGLRNARVLGSFEPFSTNGGVNFHFGNNAITNGTGLELLDPGVDPTSGIVDEVRRNREGWRLGAAYWRGHTASAVGLALRKVAWLLATDGVWTRWAMISADPQPPPAARSLVLAASSAAWYALLAAAGIELLLLRWRSAARRSAEPFGEMMLLCTVVTAAAFIGQERYHVPMVPSMAVAAAGFAARFVPPTWRTSPTPPRR